MRKLAWRALVAATLLALFVPVAFATPAALDTHVVASDKPGGFGYAVQDVVADPDGTLTLVNADLRAHDVVSFDVGPDTNPWCGRYRAGACPLFASRLVGLGGSAVVEGIDQLTPLQSYPFYCSIHPWMTGSLTAL